MTPGKRLQMPSWWKFDRPHEKSNLICALRSAFFTTFAAQKQWDGLPLASPFVVETRGKSGQHRALRYLTDRSPRGLVRAEEKNRLCPHQGSGKGEKVG